MADLMEEIKKTMAEIEAFKNGGVEALEALRAGQAAHADKTVVDGLKDVEEAVKGLKQREPYKWESQLDNLINGGEDPKIKTAREAFLKLDTYSQAEWRKSNSEGYEKLFPTGKTSVPKPQNYDQYKKLVMENPADVSKLPYAVRLYASTSDKEFDTYIQVADASKVATQETDHQRALKNAGYEG